MASLIIKLTCSKSPTHSHHTGVITLQWIYLLCFSNWDINLLRHERVSWLQRLFLPCAISNQWEQNTLFSPSSTTASSLWQCSVLSLKSSSYYCYLMLWWQVKNCSHAIISETHHFIGLFLYFIAFHCQHFGRDYQTWVGY